MNCFIAGVFIDTPSTHPVSVFCTIFLLHHARRRQTNSTRPFFPSGAHLRRYWLKACTTLEYNFVEMCEWRTLSATNTQKLRRLEKQSCRHCSPSSLCSNR
ncbi:hypothetical protein RvY_17945-2 [Ramazzottius varieornatus]|uniref:Uncharacterized protein n=1 Tax=Ramazzottius varieornatus TaxID=947166 RepID=A0A1D1WAE2_RAMVA|nr:hypothetical protein RvY_17945-2 [Ramazzottius varieornatus]